MNSMTIENTIMHRMSSFFLNGLNHPNNVVNTFFKNVLVSNSSVMLRNLNTIQNKLKIEYVDLLILKKYEIRKYFETNNTESNWRVNMIKELLNIREQQLVCDLTQNEVKELLQYLCIFR